MASFADMMGQQDPDAVGSTRDDYNAYAEACIEAGAPVLSMAKWIEAGKPKGPPK